MSYSLGQFNKALFAGHLDDDLIAVDGKTRFYGKQLKVEVLALVAGLSSRKHQRWGLYFDDTWSFTVALLALVSSGKDVVLPGNLQNDTALRVQGITDALLTDRGSIPGAVQIETLSGKGETNPFEELPVVDKATELSVFTSGSTGEPKLIEKTVRHFETEVTGLEKLWHNAVNRSVFAATVSHQHIYGLLFRVLWPLLSRRPFHLPLFQYPEELVAATNESTITLISSPAQLKRLPDSNQSSLLKGHVQKVFSSGGPLPEEANRRVSSLLEQPVTEVFGSSETGGVAWREIADGDMGWTPFERVEVTTRKGCLTVSSPHVMGDGPFVMGDAVSLQEDGRFVLQGRVDRIVKIEEKRLSLAAMESRLDSHPFVDQSTTTLLEGKRQVIGAVVVLTQAGVSVLAENGRREVSSVLRQHLLGEFERIVLPRKWRFVSALPLDAQGKLSKRAVDALFQQKPLAKDRPLELARHCDGDRAEISLQVPGDLAVFPGHFPEAAILPGVIQSAWVIQYAAQLFPLKGSFDSFERLKFQSLVRPGDKLQLVLTYLPERNRVKFALSGEQGSVSSGILVYCAGEKCGD